MDLPKVLALVHTGGKCASIVAVGSSGVAGGRLLRGRQSEKFLALSPECAQHFGWEGTLTGFGLCR